MEAETGNGRVTLAVLGNKVDNLAELLQGYIVEQRKINSAYDDRIRCLEQGQEQRKTQIAHLEDDVVDLNKKVGTWNGVNSIAVAVTAILAYFGLGK